MHLFRWLFFLLLELVLFGYSDMDLDGVDDAIDKCPSTPFSELVDESGCSVEKLSPPPLYTLLLGFDYIQDDPKTLGLTSTYMESVEIDYNYQHYSLQLQTSYFTTKSDNYNQKGLYDTYLSGGYIFGLKDGWILQPTLGVILPTYKSTYHNNKTDYFASLYIAKDYNTVTFFTTLGYTFVNDDDITTDTYKLAYQNTLSYLLGTSLTINPNLFCSLSWSKSENIYRGVEPVRLLLATLSYFLTQNSFALLGGSYGLSQSASDYTFSLKLGYNF